MLELQCSHCPARAAFDPPPTLPGLIGARYIARRSGWRSGSVALGADLCPKCAKRVAKPVPETVIIPLSKPETDEQRARRETRKAKAAGPSQKQTEAERKEAARFKARQARRKEFVGVAEVLGWAR